MKKIIHPLILVVFWILCMNVSAFADGTPGNGVPEVKFPNIADNASIVKKDLKTVSVNVYENGGGSIVHVELYVDDVLKESDGQSPYEFDLSGISVGKHTLTAKAYNHAGAIGTATVNMEATDQILVKVSEELFEGYLLPGVPSGMTGYPQAGYIKPGTVDSTHKNSLLIGFDPANVGAGDGAWVGLQTNKSKGKITFEADIYFDAKNASPNPNTAYSNCFRFEFKKAGPSGTITTSNKIVFGSSIVLSGGANGATTSVNYDAKKWYNVKIDFDMVNRTYSFYLDGVKQVSDYSFNKSDLDQLDEIRVFAPKTGVAAFIAVDNVKVSNIYEVPSIKSVTSDGNAEGSGVNYKASKLNFYLSQGIYQPSVTLDKISVQKGNDNVLIKDAAYDSSKNLITVTLVQPLKSNTVYSVKLSGNLLLAANLPVAQDVTSMFTTSMGDLEVIQGSFTNGSNGIGFSCNFVNTTTADKPVYIFVTKWNGNKAESAAAEQQTVPANTTTPFSENLPSLGPGESYEIFVWDSLTAPLNISEKVFRYSN